MHKFERKNEEHEDALIKRRLANIDKIFGNEDILREVLVRVPAKSLIKLRCVSKWWLTVISDPKFCYNHTALNPKVVSKICYYYHHKLMSVSLHSNCHQSSPSLRFLHCEEFGTRACVEDSCNGLILYSFPKQNQYSVCNLTTQKSRIIPNLEKTSEPYEFTWLAFDPARSPYYKVVLIRRSTDLSSYGVHIYSSETSSWRHVNIVRRGVYPSKKKAYWDGAIHWLRCGRHVEFDVDREIIKEIPFRKKPGERHLFGECNRNLVLILYTPNNVGDESVRIFEMNHGTRHWVVKQCVNLGEVLDIESYLEELKFHVLSVVEGLIQNDMVLVLVTATKFYAYNLRTKVLQVLCASSKTNLGYLLCGYVYGRLRCFQFCECLYPV